MPASLVSCSRAGEERRRSGQAKVAAAVARVRQEAHQQPHAGAVYAGDFADVQHDADKLTQAALDGGLQHRNLFAGDDPAAAPDDVHGAAVTRLHRQ